MDVSNRKAMPTISKELRKMRKPYTITKLREKWTDEEHNKFLEGIETHGRAWQRIQEHVGTKTAAQIRSHAQKFFLKLQKGLDGMPPGHLNGIEIPPPRPKKKQSYPSVEEVKMNTSASPSTDTVVMDAKRKKPVADTSEQSTNRRKCHSCCSSYSGNNSAYPLAEHLTMIEESVKNTRQFLHLFEMNVKSTNPQMNFAPEEIYHLLKKMDEPFTKHTLQGEERDRIIFRPYFKGAKCSGSDTSASFTEQDANTDLNLSLSPTRSKDPAISSIHQALPSSSLCDECHYGEIENASPALSGFLLDTNSFPKLHAEASIAASLLAPPVDLFSTLTDTNIHLGEAGDRNGSISSGLSAIIAATVEAAAAWWKLNGLLASPIQSNMSSATQTMVNNPAKASRDVDGDSGTKRNTKWQSCSTLLEPSLSSLETVEKIIVGKTGKPPNHSSTVTGINEINQIQQESSSCDPNTSPFSETVNVRRFRNAGRFKQGPLAFEALFSQKVLPQSFGPLHLDDDELDFRMGKKEEAYGLQKVDLNKKIFTENVCNSSEEEGASSSILMPKERKDWTE